MASADSPSPLSALSAGLAIEQMLRPIGLPVIPVYGAIPDVVPDGPAISYRRVGMETDYTKPAAARSTAIVEIWIFAPSYPESVDLAEAVRAAIEARSGIVRGIRLIRSSLANAVEDFAGDKYIQILTFNLTITPNTHTSK